MRTARVLIVVLVCWGAWNVNRVFEPFPKDYDALTCSRVGAYGYRHARCGLSVTRGANLEGVDYSSTPHFYYSYSPLAGWLLAGVFKLGAPFHPGVKGALLVAFVCFLIGLWGFVRNVWGLQAANIAVAFAAVMPSSLVYGLTCVSEVMALAPSFGALWLFSSRARRGVWWAFAATGLSVAAVMLSWISWLLVLPCVYREFRGGRARIAVIMGLLVVGLPCLIQLRTLYATDTSVGEFIAHDVHRATGYQQPGGPPVFGRRHMVRVLLERATAGLGAIPFGLCVLTLTITALGRVYHASTWVEGRRWLFLLAILGIPLNVVARNVATDHDFYTIQFVPLAAICAALVSRRVFQNLADSCGRPSIATVGIFSLVVATVLSSSWPALQVLKPTETALRGHDISIALGQYATDGAVVVGSPQFTWLPDAPSSPVGSRGRDAVIVPVYGCLTPKTMLVCCNSQELSWTLNRIGPGRRAVILEWGGDLEPLPPGTYKTLVRDCTIGLYQTP